MIPGIELEVLLRLFRLALFEGLLQLFAHLSIFLVGAGVRDGLLLLEVLGKSAVAGPDLGGDLEILLEVVLRHSDVAEHRAFRRLLEGLGIEQDLCSAVLAVAHDIDICKRVLNVVVLASDANLRDITILDTEHLRPQRVLQLLQGIVVA